MNAASHPLVLIADIGGTNARFALADTSVRPPLQEDSIRRYRVADFPSLVDAARQYLQEVDAKPRRAVLAIAGHVEQGRVHATNSPWRIEADNIRQVLGLNAVTLINDFAAQSMCLPLLGPGDIREIGAPSAPMVGRRDPQTFTVIGPGTGLGVGALLLRDNHFHPMQTEGGHCGFAPDTPEEIEILKVLSERFGRVSNERLVSGNGLVNLYEALAVIEDMTAESLEPEQITRRALQENDILCVRAVEHFCAIFGAVAGDAALCHGGWDGVFLAGGLSPLLVPWLRRAPFRQRFED
ncbi:MAG TPA: glucokinase, partial [Rhodanobacteraceae bacterium]|nr:glucokinase [Rhodanobacteraceae bacterium]